MCKNDYSKFRESVQNSFMKSRLRLKDVAVACGLGVSTVSHALRGDGNVSEATRVYVREKAEALGYRPDPMLASLAAKRFRRGEQYQGLPIAYVDFVDGRGVYGNESFYRRQVRRLGVDFGFNMSFYSLCDYNGDWERVLKRLRQVGIKGILVGDIHLEVGWEHDWSDFAIVACGRDHPETPFDQVRSSIFQGARMLWQILWQRGYRRIGCAPCRHSRELDDDAARIAAFQYEQGLAKGVRNPVPLFLGEHLDYNGYREWFLKYRPEAVIGFGAHHYFHFNELGVRCPEDVAFAALHAETEQPSHAGITGLEQNMDLIVRTSLQVLEQKLRYHLLGAPEKPMDVVIPFTWVEGKTCPRKEG